MSTPTLLILALLGWFAVHAFYRMQLRPFLMATLRRKIRRTRDSLEMAGIEEPKLRSDAGFRVALRRAEITPDVLEHISLANLYLVEKSKDVLEDAQIAANDRSISESPKIVRDANRNLFTCLVGALLVNSPFFAVVLCGVLIGVLFFDSARRWLDRLQTSAWAYQRAADSQRVCHQ